MTISDLLGLLRWPWDQYRGGGRRSHANDNDWVLWNGAWTHRLDVPSVQAYWRRMGWEVKNEAR